MSLKNRSIIHKAFDITRDNLILAQPLIIYMIVLSYTLAGAFRHTNKYVLAGFLTANMLLTCAFLAGWFFMIKQGIYLNKRIENGEFPKKEQQTEASLALGKAFFIGVSELFVNVIFILLFNFIIYTVVLLATFKLGTKLLPNPHLDWNYLYTLGSASNAEIQKYVTSLSFEQLKSVNLWMMYLMSISGILSFVTMFWFPAVVDMEPGKNAFWLSPFKSFWLNLKFIFKNFLGCAGIMIFLVVLNMLLSLMSLVFNLNIILSVIGMIFSFYFMTYAVTLIFLYYEERK